MNRKNKHDSSNNVNLIGKKRSLESESNGKSENGLIKKNSLPTYDSISGLYKNIFGFNWTDSIFKEGQQIIENLTPDAIIFLYNTLYFKQDLYNINLLNKGFLLNSFFDPFDLKYPDVISIKKSQIIHEKVNFIFKMIELFYIYNKNKNKVLSLGDGTEQNIPNIPSKEENFHNFHNFIFQKYQHIKF